MQWNPKLVALARTQHGAISVAQARNLGYSRSALSRFVAAGLVYRAHHAVYVLGVPTGSRGTQRWAALLAGGAGALLSHRSAGALWTRSRFTDAPVPEIVIPRQHRPVVGILIHRTRVLTPSDCAVVDGFPVTSLERTLMDLGSQLTALQLANVMHEAAYLHPASMGAITEAPARFAHRLGMATFTAALELHRNGSAGTRSQLEDRAHRRLCDAGLAPPRVNMRIAVDGRRIEVDFAWPSARLCVEIDGPGHRRRRTRRSDRDRDQALRAVGWTVLRFDRDTVDGEPERLVHLVAHCLERAPVRPRAVRDAASVT